MGQISFSDAECAAKRKKTRREVFLEEMVPVVPWKAVLGLEQIGDLLHGKEQDVWADSGYRGAQSRMARDDLKWHIAGRPSDMAKLPRGSRSNGSRSKSTARPACARRSSTRFGSSSDSSDWRRSGSGAWRRTPGTWSRYARCQTCGWHERD